jgi:hypothetical protein
VTAVAAVHPEIRVGRDNHGIRERFRHANEARIGEAHGNVGIFLDKPDNRLDIRS